MSESAVQMIRSVLASVIGIAASMLAIAAIVAGADIVTLPSWWGQAIAVVTVVGTAARTALAYLDPKNTSYGLTTESVAAWQARRRG